MYFLKSIILFLPNLVRFCVQSHCCVVSNKTIKLKMWCCNKNSTTDATGEADTVYLSGAWHMPLVKQILFTLPEHDRCHWWSRYCLPFRSTTDATGEADTVYPSGAWQMPLVKQILFTLPEHDRCHWRSRYCFPFRNTWVHSRFLSVVHVARSLVLIKCIVL